MKKTQDPPADATAPRRGTEERLQARERNPQSMPDKEQLVHELQVHQIELEMQNEELRQARARVQTLLAQYTDLYDFAPAGYLTLDRVGAIRQVNRTGARLLGVECSRLLKRRFGLFVAEGDRRAFSDFLQTVFASQAKPSCEVTLPQAGQHPLHVRIEGTRSANGEECLAVVVDITERKRTEWLGLIYRDQLRALSARIEKMREDERTRISREIHDELGQMLTGIKMDLRWMEHRLDEFGEDRRVNPILDKLVVTTELTDATIKTVQRMAAELRPGILDKLGLPITLQYEAGRFEKRTGIACRLVVPGEALPLRPEAATAFFRIFQEALTNVARHAKATAVEAELQPEADGCRLEIRDNGQGMAGVDPKNLKSLGLLGMQERAALLGGGVSFAPRPGGGTVVTVRIPNRPTQRGGV
jgi:PAS domain S-box-containing protein